MRINNNIYLNNTILKENINNNKFISFKNK